MLTKYASLESAQVLEIKGSSERLRTASLDKFADYDDYRTDDGYLYARIRAISSRVNKNHDGWPTEELAGGKEAWAKISSQHTAGEGFTIQASKDNPYGFSTFLGKPNFIDHHNSDPKRARGIIVDSKFSVLDHKTASEDDYWKKADIDKEHLPASEVELLVEIDAKSFPKYAEAVINGDLDGWSMGCDVDYSKCSHCGNKASSPDEYCSHIISKGAEHTASDGQTKKSYENCYGIKFFEISGVFDPADETARSREVRAAVEKEADNVFNSPEPHEVLRRAVQLRGLDGNAQPLEAYMQEAEADLSGRFNIEPGSAYGEGQTYDFKVKNADPLPTAPGPSGTQQKFPLPNTPGIGAPLVPDRLQGAPEGYAPAAADAILQEHPDWKNIRRNNPYTSSVKTAQPEPPQSEHIKAPQEVDTHRKEKICPLCGSDMDSEQCAVCGYEEPPEQLQNPDLHKNDDMDMGEEVATIPNENPVTPPQQNPETMATQTRNPQAISSVNNRMRWAPKIALAPKPQGDEPNETVTSDQTTPVTSAMRTARQLIDAAKNRNQENHMANEQRTAAEPVPAAKADKRVDVEGVGGVMQDNNADASKPEGAHSWEPKGTTVDVTGKGGVLEDSNAEASKPSVGTESVEKKTDITGTPTKTFDNSNEPGTAVSDKAFPTASAHDAAKQGVKPIGGPDVQPQRRENVEEDGSIGVAPGTEQWKGTGGNGVTKQQDPVTKTPTQSGGVKASGFISLAALKLADAEVALGLLAESEKYNRLAELEGVDDAEIAAEHRALSKVRTAGFTRTAAAGGAHRVPSFKRIASEAPQEPVVDDDALDSGLYR